MPSETSSSAVLQDFAFFYPLRVRWAELDPQGIVFNPNYFMYADLAVTEYMRAVGFVYPSAFEEHGTDTFTVNASANFRAPAGYDDELRIGIRTAQIGRTSMRFEIGVFRDGQLLADVSMTYVIATRDARTPAPVPQALIDRILTFERTPPTRKSRSNASG